MATTLSTTPFPRISGVRDLTWDQCFTLDRGRIKAEFVDAIVQNAFGESNKGLKQLAVLLSDMISVNEPKKLENGTTETTRIPQTQSVAIMTDFKGPKWSEYPKILPFQEGIDVSKLGRVHWRLMGGGPGLKLYCHTIYDLLAACMSGAAWRHDDKPGDEEQDKNTDKRDKDNYFAPLASLYSYWCLRLSPGRDKHPTMTSLTCLDNIILLGCSIPTVPGQMFTPGGKPLTEAGKELILRSRLLNLEGRGRQKGSDKEILDLKKVVSVEHKYGNCAETWAFGLICAQETQNLLKVYGISVKTPTHDVQRYNEREERKKERYAQLCWNCRTLLTQIDLWGKSPDSTQALVRNFNVDQWTLVK